MSVARFSATRIEGGRPHRVSDALTVEAPLHIKVNGASFTTTMRTPGNDHELARGLLFTEGILGPEAIPELRETLDPESGLVACIEVTVPDAVLQKSVDGRRSTLSSSSCGVCGTREPADIEIYGPPIRVNGNPRLGAAQVPEMFAAMRRAQTDFSLSGGSHAAAAFAVDGSLLVAREDIGRHNAVDKVVGELLMRRRLGDAACLAVSGRVSYEIVYKTYRAQIPFLISVSAPSSMAVETAQRLGMTVIAFCRDQRMTVYTNRQNVSDTA